MGELPGIYGKRRKGKIVYDKIKLIKSRSQKVNTFAAK